MERRHSERTIFNLEAELISKGKNYTGFIKNLTEDGIRVTTAPMESAMDFVPGTIVELKLQLSSGETIDLLCRTMWLYSYKLLSLHIVNNIGMQIINPPQRYKEFIKTL
jgi:hypothetical protein